MRIAVTGATGMVGGQVVAAALAAGHQVLAIARPDADRRRTRLTVGSHSVPVATVTLTDPTGLREALDGCDALVHCAAVYAFGDARAAEVGQVNADGTRAVLEAAAAAGVTRAVVTLVGHAGIQPAPPRPLRTRHPRVRTGAGLLRKQGRPGGRRPGDRASPRPRGRPGAPDRRARRAVHAPGPEQRHRAALPAGPDPQHLPRWLQRRRRPRCRRRSPPPSGARRPRRALPARRRGPSGACSTC